MEPRQDVQYRIHRLQAGRRGQSPLSCEQFRGRLRGAVETDLTGWLMPAAKLAIRVEVRHQPKFSLGRMCITAAAAQAVPTVEVVKALARHRVEAARITTQLFLRNTCPVLQCSWPVAPPCLVWSLRLIAHPQARATLGQVQFKIRHQFLTG